MRYVTIALMAIVFWGCEGGDSMSEIKYFEKGEEELEVGKILLMWANYTTEEGKDLISTQPEIPLAMQYDSSTVAQTGVLKGFIDRLKVGDSVAFKVPSKNLWEVTFRRPLPDTIAAESNITVNMKIIDQVNMEEYTALMKEYDRKRNSQYYAAEEDKLNQYLEENNISPVVTPSGLRYVIHSEGSGRQAEANDMVNVGYRGTLLDGTQFDAGDYEFILGRGAVISGWDEGIGYLKVGSRATLYIPSYLGYGDRGSGGRIPPFSSLIFEVELIEAQVRDR